MGAVNSSAVNSTMVDASDSFVYDLSASFTITSTSEATAISYVPLYAVCDMSVQATAYMTRQVSSYSISTISTLLSGFIAGVFNIQSSMGIDWTFPTTYVNRIISPAVTSTLSMEMPLAYTHGFAKGNPAILISRWGLEDNASITPIVILPDPYI